jgi:RNA polymerase sigma-70 factor (ECF subfamily)
MAKSFTSSWSNQSDCSITSVNSLEKLSNSDLILLCQIGNEPDRPAFAELLKRYQFHLDRILYHLAPDWQDRPDLAQEVWFRVYRNIKKLNEPNRFRCWLSRIATNLFYDELRKRKRISNPISLDAPRQLIDGEMDWDIVSDYPNPEDNLCTQEFYEKLREAIADLPEAFRITIILRELHEMPYEEISQITGVTLGTVKSRINRARAKLQSVLEPYSHNL